MSEKPSSETNPSDIWTETEIMDSRLSQDTTPSDADISQPNQQRRNILAGNDSTNPVRSSKTKFSRHQTVTLINISLAVFVNWLTYSIIIVFYPTEAEAKGMSQTAVGLVFSTYSITASIASPIWGKIIPAVGSRFLFLIGAFVTGCCNILFGLLIYMPTESTFEVFSYILRIVQGLGTSACVTASTVIVAYAFPENTGTAVGVLEMIIGAASGIGPAIGGLLYDLGGFTLPFFVLGCCVLATVLVNYVLMPRQGSSDDRVGSMSSIARIPAVWFAFLAVVSANIGLSFLYPTLTPYLEQELNFTVVESSLAFGGCGLTYAVTAILWGRIADKTEATRLMIFLGALSSAVSFLFLGPSPILRIRPNKWLMVFALTLSTISIGLILMSSLTDMFISVRWYGIKQDLGNSAIVCGLFQSAIATGVIFGPMIGGALADSVGFGYGTTVVASGFLVLMLIIGLFGLWEHRCGRGRRVPKMRLVGETSSTEVDERTLLLSKEI